MDKLSYLIDYLKNEHSSEIRGLDNLPPFEQFRALVNIRYVQPISDEFLSVQDEYLKEIIVERGVTSIQDLKPIVDNIYVWQGDITSLQVDAIVNAANSAMLGCFVPLHKCIDNAIHTFAGVQLRLECDKVMKAQGHEEQTGVAKITDAYNLPSKYVIHTVGPIVHGALTDKHKNLLACCYKNCFDIAMQNNVKSIAFCCISTGEFMFPNYEAAEIAIATVKQCINETNSDMKIVFNVFKEVDLEIYERLLK